MTVLLFLGLVCFRLFNTISVQTFFQPDEYFQSLEPAWALAFGPDAGAWITWEWREQLRSAIHPVLFSGAYKAVDQICTLLDCRLSSRVEALAIAPRLLQAVIAAVGDLYTQGLARRVYPGQESIAFAALLLTLVSPWQWFCSVRTLSNSLETTLTVVGLYYWPWSLFLQSTSPSNKGKGGLQNSKEGRSQIKTPASTSGSISVSLAAAALACILRPTNIIIWATISIYCLNKSRKMATVVKLGQAALLCGSTILAVSVSIDYNFYNELTFPPWKFLYFNVVQSLASFYGQNRLDYYLTEGLPLLLTTALPFAYLAMWQTLRSKSDESGPSTVGLHSKKALATTVVFTVLVMSLISHKEVRFIYPLLPLLLVLSAEPVAKFFHPLPIPASEVKFGVIYMLMAVNVFIAAYVSLIHQRGVIDVVNYLRHEQTGRLESPGNATGDVSVGFLMPCHSTPWRSLLVHKEIEAWALTCEPPLGLALAERDAYMDEADLFYDDPSAWIQTNMAALTTAKISREDEDRMSGDKRPWPEYVVFFEQLEPTMDELLKDTEYHECWRGFNTHWHDDWRRQGDVITWCLR